jgi:hypothetical protein
MFVNENVHMHSCANDKWRFIPVGCTYLQNMSMMFSILTFLAKHQCDISFISQVINF